MHCCLCHFCREIFNPILSTYAVFLSARILLCLDKNHASAEQGKSAQSSPAGKTLVPPIQHQNKRLRCEYWPSIVIMPWIDHISHKSRMKMNYSEHGVVLFTGDGHKRAWLQGWNKSMVSPCWQQNPYIDQRKRRKQRIWRNIRRRQQMEKRKKGKRVQWTKLKSNQKRRSPKKQAGGRGKSRERPLSSVTWGDI